LKKKDMELLQIVGKKKKIKGITKK
jgi:hypothetical protein